MTFVKVKLFAGLVVLWALMQGCQGQASRWLSDCPPPASATTVASDVHGTMPAVPLDPNEPCRN